MKKDVIIPLVIGTLICVVGLVFGGFAVVEPQLVKADATSTTVTLTVGEEVSLTVSTSTVAMSPNITMTQDSSIGSCSWTVTTNAQAGYTLDLHADDANCLDCAATSEYFTDATTTKNTWSNLVDVDSYIFGFSVYGDDVGGWGTGSSCGTGGTPSATLHYSGFNSTNNIQVASSTSETSQTGTATTMCVAAEQGSNVYAPDGTYTTTITGTAAAQ
ncbi:hypothetical protein AMJ49_06465 [Parcubacteria bacterium DG_74_2]|nr:MAG: hypothetical protein AMJ49_06465 [Parcubacteria bacterium DG_74_2]